MGALLDVVLFLALWFGVAMLLALLVGRILRLGSDDDAPAHVSRQSWERVTRRKR